MNWKSVCLTFLAMGVLSACATVPHGSKRHGISGPI